MDDVLEVVCGLCIVRRWVAGGLYKGKAEAVRENVEW